MTKIRLPMDTNYGLTRLGVSLQKTLNVYPHMGRGYRMFPGLTEFALIDSGGADRGADVMGGLLYVVSGTKLWSVASDGTETDRGTITGSARCVLANDGTTLLIATGSTLYSYTVAGGLTTVGDASISDNPDSVAFLNSHFILEQDDGQFLVSAAGDGTCYDALDYATAEGDGDGLKRVFAARELLFLFGERTTEVWYNSGRGRPPFDRQFVLRTGIAGRYAVSQHNDVVYFLDDNKVPKRFVNPSEIQSINTPALGEEFEGYTVSDCIVQTTTLRNEDFAIFSFPTQDKTWAFHAPSQAWFELGSDIGGNDGDRFFGQTFIKAHGKNLCIDHTSGEIFELDFSKYTHDGTSIKRQKDSVLLTSEMLERAPDEIALNAIFGHYDTSGSASVSISTSQDMSSFGSSRSVSPDGNETMKISQWGTAREHVIRQETSSDVRVDFLDLAVDIEVNNA